ncbi:MAG TPA: rhodanese-like domain-containing protein [Oceanospirillales bacterium]|nr:rhodanese-like domain-containing protein [Oceanospirillales bacterium]
MINAQQLVLNALTEVDEISVNNLALLTQNNRVNLLDIRESEEVEQGVIPGSIWIPRGLLEFQILSLVDQLNWDVNDEIYICCRSGNRSALAAKSLLEMGFNKPVSVAGGFTAWRDSGYSVTTDILHF